MFFVEFNAFALIYTIKPSDLTISFGPLHLAKQSSAGGIHRVAGILIAELPGMKSTGTQPHEPFIAELIALKELFETAYFSQLLDNVTNSAEGYEVEDKDYVVKTLRAVLNQEQLHALAANDALSTASKQTVEPCEYKFPVDNFDDAIALARTFTEVVLGVLPLAQTTFAEDGGEEIGLVQVVGSIIAQEGEQTGYYRYLQKKVASSAPFLTGGAPQFAFTAMRLG
ncbi:hypothetical protein BJ878DRAFT_484268 [Calycina marina]|uniref:Uncharacterized protein n=1 Tax=Calycina marina TaxID=1763456 RepID=A0A9P7YUC4_9HELO|nr:hypothetical protein BJ878DRAFT_484268 [Calycina marina]